MNDQPSQPSGASPAGQPQRADSGADEALKKVLESVLKTREARASLAEVIPVVLKIWAGESGWKGIVSRAAAGTLKKGFAGPFGNSDEALEQRFEDPEFIKSLSVLTTEFIAVMEDVLIAGVQTLEHMHVDEKKKCARKILSRLVNGKTGDIVSRCARMINEIQQSDPGFIARVLEPGVRKWAASVDFGEVKEAVDGSGQGLVSLVETANDVMWQYPAKVILLLSLLPSLVNILGRSALVSVGKLEETPPDLLTDIVISLLREIDTPMIVGMVNEISEIGRKLHTGSALLGEAGAPELPKLFSEKLEEIIEGTDPVIFWKARVAIAEIKASFDQAMDEAVCQNRDHMRQAMVNHPVLANIRRQGANQRLLRFESMDDGEFDELWAQRLAGYDAQETAEVVNNFLRLINRLGDRNPEALAGLVSRFSSAIDDDALAEAVQRLFDDTDPYLRPVARSVVPGLVAWACQVLKPEDDAYEVDAARARDALRSLLMPGED